MKVLELLCESYMSSKLQSFDCKLHKNPKHKLISRYTDKQWMGFLPFLLGSSVVGRVFPNIASFFEVGYCAPGCMLFKW